MSDSVYLLGECSYERAALPMGRPRYAEAGSLIFIGDRDGRHGVCDFGQRRIESDLVSTEMIFVADATGLHGGKMTGSKQRRSMVLVIVQNLQVHGSSDNALNMGQQLTAHLLREAGKRCTLAVLGVGV